MSDVLRAKEFVDASVQLRIRDRVAATLELMWAVREEAKKARDIELLAIAKMFLGLPERWTDTGKWRCAESHISMAILKSEALGDTCLSCGTPVLLTFPEDTDDSELGAEIYSLRMSMYQRAAKGL